MHNLILLRFPCQCLSTLPKFLYYSFSSYNNGKVETNDTEKAIRNGKINKREIEITFFVYISLDNASQKIKKSGVTQDVVPCV